MKKFDHIAENFHAFFNTFWKQHDQTPAFVGLSRNIVIAYSCGVGILLSVNVFFLAFEPHHADERGIHVLDAFIFLALNAAILASSLWVNVRLHGASLRKRLAVNASSYLALCCISIALHYPVWRLLTHGPPMGFYVRDEFLRGLLLFCMSIILARMLELSAYQQRMKTELDAIRQASLLGQIESLKQQINPHFFFNSLNTLSGLAREDADKTIEFIEKLSQVFRTVLEIQQKDMVSLGEELEFAGAFLYLLNVRFEGKFICEIASEPIAEAMFWLPPLSSQLLLENVVKHNRMTRQNPVRVKMFVEFRTLESAYFVVENSYAPLKNSSGTRTGLANLTKRSELLTGEPIVIEQDTSIFRVKVPLSKGSKNEPRITRR